MRVRVLFFGMLKDLLGRPGEDLDLPDGARLETVFDHYASQVPKLRAMARSIVMARNHEFEPADTPLSENDEVALMPPVSGGSGDGAATAGESPWISSAREGNGSFYAITNQRIDVQQIAADVIAGQDGAVITFEGVVRDHSGGRKTRYLEYECYVPVALKKMREIGAEVVAEHGVHRVAIVHRLGRLEISETSVAIVVTSAHRKAAYEASFETINRLKRLVPIWKKEYFEDGEVWVEGEWDESVPRPAAAPR
jgi:molybdopterin synthase catalytic subunit